MTQDPDPTNHPDLRALRHDIRGRMNALILCATALDDSIPVDEALEFLGHIEQTAEKLIELLEQLEVIS